MEKAIVASEKGNVQHWTTKPKAILAASHTKRETSIRRIRIAAQQRGRPDRTREQRPLGRWRLDAIAVPRDRTAPEAQINKFKQRIGDFQWPLKS